MFRRPLLLLLRSCAAAKPATTHAVAACRGGVIRQTVRASTTRSGFLQNAWPLLSAVKSGQLGLCSKAGEPCEDPSQTENKDVFIVQVKGLHESCSAQDLMDFFSECNIRDGLDGIHLVMDKLGRSTGQAFITLEYEQDVNRALEKHLQYLGPRYVQVLEVTDSEAETILQKANEVRPEDWMVRLRGLPFSSSDSDIVQFFSGLDIAENGITVIKDHRGRNSGEAFVQFCSQEAVDAALQRDRELIFHRYIEVFPSTLEECNTRRSRSVHSSPTNLRTGSRPTSRSLHYIHMRGLPFQVTVGDIVKFFYPLTVSKILMEYRPDGRSNGKADVYFACHEDAAAAMSRDREYIGERYVELFLNSESNER